MSGFTALETLLDPLFEGDHGFFAITIHRKYSGQSNHWHALRYRTAIDMAMRAAHFIADVTLRIFWRLIENMEAQADAVAKRALRDRSRVRRYPIF